MLQNVEQSHRGCEVGGLHEQMVAVGPHKQEVALLKALLEEGIEHILCGEVEFQRTVVGVAQFAEATAQGLRGVGHVLHHMGGAPHLGDAVLLVALQDLEGGRHRTHAVVHPGKEVAVVVDETSKGRAQGG